VTHPELARRVRAGRALPLSRTAASPCSTAWNPEESNLSASSPDGWRAPVTLWAPRGAVGSRTRVPPASACGPTSGRYQPQPLRWQGRDSNPRLRVMSPAWCLSSHPASAVPQSQQRPPAAVRQPLSFDRELLARYKSPGGGKSNPLVPCPPGSNPAIEVVGGHNHSSLVVSDVRSLRPSQAKPSV
jgi:hypothetical protein